MVSLKWGVRVVGIVPLSAHSLALSLLPGPPSPTHLVRVKQFPEALLELHALPAARAHVDEDEEGDDAGGDHGRIHGRQQDHCNERRRLLMSKEACIKYYFRA